MIEVVIRNDRVLFKVVIQVLIEGSGRVVIKETDEAVIKVVLDVMLEVVIEVVF